MRSGAGCQQHCGPRRKPPIVSVPVLHTQHIHRRADRKKKGRVCLGEGGGDRGTVRKEEGQAERSRLGEWLERGIGQRAGWAEPKRPIVSGGGRELYKQGGSLRSCLRPAASLLQRGVASSDPAYSLPIKGQSLKKIQPLKYFVANRFIVIAIL